MGLKTKQAVEELLSYTIITDKGSLVSLLQKSGVKLSSNPSDAEVTTAVLVANKRSKAFRKDLAALLGKKLPKAGEKFKSIVGDDSDFGFTGVDDVTYMRWTGVDDFSDFTGWDDFKNATADQKAAKAKAKADARAARGGKTAVGSALAGLWDFTKTNVLTKDNINAGIQAGLNKVNADTAAKQAAIEEKSLALQQQQSDLRASQGVTSGPSTNTWLLIGGGVLVVTVVLIFAFKKK